MAYNTIEDTTQHLLMKKTDNMEGTVSIGIIYKNSLSGFCKLQGLVRKG